MSDDAEPHGQRKTFVVRNSSSHRVVHTTPAGLTSADAKADAEEQLKGFEATHPEQTFEIVQS